jgi:hypothetical protein
MLVSVAHAGPTDPVTEKWAKHHLKNVQRAAKIPVWQITQYGTNRSVKWVDLAFDTRFAIYDSGTPGDETDDMVLDKETGLVWARDAGLSGIIPWQESVDYCRNFISGNRAGWRLPTIEELLSLFDLTTYNRMPPGVFRNVHTKYWSSTEDESDSSKAYTFVTNGSPITTPLEKTFATEPMAWPVRGGIAGRDAGAF